MHPKRSWAATSPSFSLPETSAADRPGQILRRAGAEGNCDADGMYLMADGIARRSDARVTAQFDASGALLGFVVLAQEISGLRDQEEAERELRSQKLFGDIMMESMPGILYLYDTQGRFLRWNRTFETASGYTAEEIARMHPLDFFPERARQNVKSRIDEVFATGASSVEADFMAKDGSLVPYSFNGRRVRFQGRECLVGVGIDIAELVRAQADLAESESQLPEAVRILPGRHPHRGCGKPVPGRQSRHLPHARLCAGGVDHHGRPGHHPTGRGAADRTPR